MRKLWIVFVAGLVAVSLAGIAQAGTLAYEGTIGLELGTLPTIPVTGSGIATVNGSGGGGHLTQLHIDSGITTQNPIVVPITDPAVGTIPSLRATKITVNGSYTLGFTGGGLLTPNVLPVSGTVLVCIVAKGCGSNLVVPLTLNGTRGLGIGGGVITVNGFAQAGLRISIQGNPWMVGKALITGIPQDNGELGTSSRDGFVHGPASNTSSTALPSGVVQLVTPVLVQTTLMGNEVLALFGILKLHFIPEPGTLLLLGSGVMGLAILGRRRMK